VSERAQDVAIIDSGGANAASVQFALARLGCHAELTSDPQRVWSASHVILPGVGSASDAMRRLRASGLDEVIPRVTRPLLGICLGMQLLYERSEEHNTLCLGAIRGVARRLVAASDRPVPHMGWNTLELEAKSPLMTDIPRGTHAYFVHSYAVPIGPETLARTEYGAAFSAVGAHGNFFGTQFHPERSGAAGARLLSNFRGLQ
jgi:glutamine amidotransferase